VGFDPRSHRVAGVWLGNDDNRPTQGSGALAAALWGDIIQAAGPAPPPAP
jgi:membrane peptidoglycan carboxypeptidase